MTIFYLSFALFALIAMVGAVILLVRKLRKRDIKSIRRFTLIMLGVSVLSLVLPSMCTDIAAGCLLLAIFTLATAIILLISALIKKHREKQTRRAFVRPAIAFGLAILFTVAFSVITIADFPGENSSNDNYEISINTEYDFEVKDGTEPLEVVTSSGCEKINHNSVMKPYRMVYDSSDLHYVLNNYNATAEDCLKALENNKNISSDYKAYFADFIQRIGTIYPEANLSILCENLKTLEVVELNKMDYIIKSLSVDSCGCYMRTENIIYIPEGTEYIEGEWGFQVLIHEFCHAARTRWVEHDDVKDRLQFCSEPDNTLLEESMNSAFSCSLLNYYERDIAYQVPSNYLRIMLECMDNYTLDDYINHSEVYFLKCLDEYTGYTNYAQVIWKLITLQRSDWEDDKTEIASSEYEPIYDYLCQMYYEKYITPDMTDEECKAVAAELIDKAFFDAPEDYKTDPEYFYEYLEMFRENQKNIA